VVQRRQQGVNLGIGTAALDAHRALNKHLNGGCQVPIACYALLEDEQLWLRGLVGQPDGGLLLRAEGRASAADAEALGVQVAEALLAQGANAILAAVYGEAGQA
jgi:hydroxymethylbilane synthase